MPGTGRQFVPAQPPPLRVWLDEGAAAGAGAGVAVGAVGVLVTGGGGEDVVGARGRSADCGPSVRDDSAVAAMRGPAGGARPPAAAAECVAEALWRDDVGGA